LQKDFRGTLRLVARMGYKGVEIGGDTGGMTPAELRQFLNSLGLEAISWHSAYDQITSSTQSVIDFGHELGAKFVVCPVASGKRAGDYYAVAKALEKAGERLKQEGIRLCYHNHAHEFQEFSGHRAIDIILANSKRDLLAWELDTFWVQAGGCKPQDYIRKYAGRVPLMHVKDMTPGPKPTFAEVGAGILPWEEIFSAADEAGVEHYIVEQDVCQRPALESVRISLDNLRKMGVAE